MNRLLRTLQVGVAAMLIALPLVLFAFGERGDPVENRASPQFPGLDVPRFLDTEYTSRLESFVDAAFPFRDELIRTDARIDLALGDSPSPRVRIGDGGWLFLTEITEQRCVTATLAEEVVHEIERARRVLDVVGKSLTIGVAPGKASLYGDKLNGGVVCPPETARNLAAIAERAGLVTGWEALRTGPDDPPTFLRLDTHWNPSGAAIFSELLIDEISPGLWDPNAVEEFGRRQTVGNLTRVMGVEESEEEVRVWSRFDGKSPERSTTPLYNADGQLIVGRQGNNYRSSWDGAIPGDTLVLHDSFGWAAAPLLNAYFERSRFIRDPSPSPSYVHESVRDADSIVRLTTQPDFYDQLVEDSLAAGLVAALAPELQSEPVRLECATETCAIDVGTVSAGDRYLLVDRGTEAIAELVVAGEVVSLGAGFPLVAVRIPETQSSIEISMPADGLELSIVVVPR